MADHSELFVQFSNLPTNIKPSLVTRVPRDQGFRDPGISLYFSHPTTPTSLNPLITNQHLADMVFGTISYHLQLG